MEPAPTPKQHVVIWPLGKVVFTYPIIVLWIVFYLMHLAGKDSPWCARVSFALEALVFVIVFIDVRRNLAIIGLIITGLVFTIIIQAVGFGAFSSIAEVLGRYGTGFAAEFHFLLAMLLVILIAFDNIDCFLNRRIKIDDKHIELLQPGEGQKLFDLNQVIVEYRKADYLEWLLLQTGTISIYSKNGSDKGMLIVRAEHVRWAKSLYDQIQEFINVD
jgi:hypothetical protein